MAVSTLLLCGGASRVLQTQWLGAPAGGSGITFYQGPDNKNGTPTQDMHDNVRCVYNCSVIFSLEILNLHWDSLLLRDGPVFALRNIC
jgi:hypothetical protein